MSANIPHHYRQAFLTPRIFSAMAGCAGLGSYLSDTATMAKVKEITENPNKLDIYWNDPGIRTIAETLSKATKTYTPVPDQVNFQPGSDILKSAITSVKTGNMSSLVQCFNVAGEILLFQGLVISK